MPYLGVGVLETCPLLLTLLALGAVSVEISSLWIYVLANVESLIGSLENPSDRKLSLAM